MKLAYVTCEEPVHAWAGLVYHIGRSLEPYAEVSHAGPLAYKGSLADSELCAHTVAMGNAAEQPDAAAGRRGDIAGSSARIGPASCSASR